MKLHTRLFIFTALFVLLTAVFIGAVGYRTGLDSYLNQSEKLVTQARDQKSLDIKTEFEKVGKALRTLAGLVAARDFVPEISEQRRFLNSKIQIGHISPEMMKDLQDYFQPTSHEQARLLIPKMLPSTLFIQWQYIRAAREQDTPIENIASLKNPPPFDFFKSVSEIHPLFADFVDQYELEDLLVADTSGQVLYSIAKNANFGANLQTGVFSSSPLANAYRWSLSASVGAFRVFDLAPQSSLQPHGSFFVAIPIYENGRIEGSLIAQISNARVQSLLATQGPVEVSLLTRQEIPPRSKSIQATSRLLLPGVEWQVIAKLRDSAVPRIPAFLEQTALILIPLLILLWFTTAYCSRKAGQSLRTIREDLENSRVPEIPSREEDEFTLLIRQVQTQVIELENLRGSYQFLTNSIENAQDIVFLIDEDQKIILSSAFTEEALGVPQHSLKGSPLNTFLDISESKLKLPHRKSDAVLKNISGKIITVELSWVQIPHPLHAGKSFYLLTGTDITHRRELERDFETLSTLFREAQSSFHIGSYSWNLQTNETFWSEEKYRILGLDPAKVEPSFALFHSLIHVDDHLVFDREMEKSSQTLLPFVADLRIRKANTQEIIWVRSTARTVFDDYGNPSVRYGTIQDITEMKRAENSLITARNEALKSSQAKSEFLARMSHEIRTPMNAIMGMADLLKETRLSEDQNYYVTIFVKAGEVLMGLINDILDLSKIEAGEVSLENIPFDLQQMLRDIQEIMKPRAQEKGLEFSYDIHPQVSTHLLGDPTKIRQVLTNLISNSLKFTERGSIRIHINKNPTKKDHLLISVTDTGLGIPVAKQHLIFQKFSQADSSITRKFGGTGLGLAISKSLVELLGGQIWFKSRESVGTSFFITLPYHEQIMHPVTHKPIAMHAEKLDFIPKNNRDPQHKIRILLADDTEDNRILFSRYLEKEPFEIIEAENGLEAIDKIKSGKFDIIFMDVQMPEMDGYAATAEIREWEKAHHQVHTPIIALTAHALSEDRTKSIKAGCDDHITKPFKKKTILSVIEKYS